MELQVNRRLKIDISGLKHRFVKHYPNSTILLVLLSMPDEISAEELIGATTILLDLLDRESHNNLNEKIREGDNEKT
jgi:hypothetical protein